MIALAVESIYLSAGHTYVGRFGQKSASHPIQAVRQAECIAGQGIVGDRFFGHKADFKGQVTFFSTEVFESLCQAFNVFDRPAWCFRRNFLVRGADLNQLIGVRFCLQGIWFEGVEECRPCVWMNEAFCPGAEAALRGRGGLRAKLLSSGVIQVNALLEECVVQPAEPVAI